MLQANFKKAPELPVKALAEASTSSGDTKTAAKPRQRQKATKGGCVCVQWNYSHNELGELKTMYAARSRHEAVFVDVVHLLHDGGHSPLNAVSISRDERYRAGLPTEHFGNGAVLVRATLPPLPASGVEVAAA